MRPFILLLFLFLFSSNISSLKAQSKNQFHVIAFYTAKNDLAHISFVHDANKWFPVNGKKISFHI